jgi:phage-related protein
MAGAFRIAEGFVEVTADESGYDRAMQRLKNKKNTVGVKVVLDDKSALAQLGRLTADRVLRVRVDVDKTALTQLKMQDVEVSILPKISDAAYRRVQTQLDRLTADRTVRILATADTRVAADEIRNLTQRRRVRIGVDVDTRVAADDIANLTRRRTVRVTADADTTAAAARIAHLTRDRRIDVTMNVDRSAISLLGSIGGAAGSAGMLGGRFAALAGAALTALPAVAALGQAIVQMGPAAAVAVPALGSLVTMGATLAVGLRGVGSAFSAASAMSNQGSAQIASAARAVESAHLNVARAARALKEAESDAARQITEARARVRDAAEDVRDAEVRAAADRRAALQRVKDAERDLADAQRDARQAQEDLNEARKEAAEQLEDLNSRLAGAQLDERQAVLDVADAEKDLAAVKAKGSKATAEELAQAQLDYERAVQRLKDQQTETARLREETSEANKAGVEGSDTVRDAQDRLADSTRTVGDRTRAVRDAQAEVAQVARDGAESVRDAQQRLADAQQGVADAQVAAARQVRTAQEALADAQRAVTAATEQSAVAASKYADAMAKLSPNARSFVTAVRDMAPAFSALRMEVQDRLFRGLGDSFTRMATASLPALRTGLGGMADVLNRMATGVMDTFTRLADEGLLERMFSGFTAGMKPLEKVPGQFSEMFVKLGIAAAPAMKRITTAIGNAFTRVGGKLDEAFKSGRLEKAINKALDLAIAFGKVLGDVFATVGNIMGAASKGAGDVLGGLGATFAELRRITAMPEVQEALTTIFRALSDIGKLVAVTFGAVLQAVLPLLAALAPVVSELAQKFAPVLVRLAETLGKALMPIMDALLPVVEDLGDILVRLVNSVMPLLKPIGDLLATVVTAIAPVLPVVGDIVVMLVGALVKGLKPVIDALIPAVATFGRFIGQLAPLLTPLYQAFTPLIPVLGQMAAALINLAMSVIEPMLPLIVRLAGLMSGVLAGAINTLVPVITTVVQWLTTFAEKAAEVVDWVVGKFRAMYDELVGHSIIPDMVREIIRWFTSLWTSTKKLFTGLKDWVVKTWRDLWTAVRERWNTFWTGLRGAVTGAWKSLRDSVTGLRTSVSNTWSGLWTGARDKVTGIFTTIKDRVGSFKTSMMNAFTTLRDSLGRVWDGLKSKIASPVRYVVGTVYNNGIRRMWNAIAGKINSSITLPTIKLGFNKGGVVPGQGNKDTVPAMLTPGERILSKSQVAQLGGQRGIDAMLGKDRPTKTGGNPGRQEERRRQQGTVQHFDQGGIVGNITSGIGDVVGSVTDWAKDVVVGNLKSVAQKALRSMVSPLIGRIPNTGIGNLMRGLVNRGVDGMMGWFGKEDKKAVGGPGVQKALSWAKTQHGLPYQWGGNGNPSWDCSGLTSAIESVIRGERPHRRWATGSFVGNNGPAGWVRNLNSPYMIGITNSGVGHTAGTIAGVNVESRGGDGVVIGKRARSYKDSMFTSRWGFAPAAKFDSGGLLQPGATMAINNTRKPEAVLTAEEHAAFRSIVSNSGMPGVGEVVVNMTVNSLTMPSPAERKRFADAMAGDINEAVRKWNKGRAR